MKNRLLALVLFATLLCGITSATQAHDIFQDVMKEKYHLKSFSCKTCHPDSKDRKLRSMFAEMIYQELKDKNFSAKWAEVEPQGKAAIAEFEKSIVNDFKAAMDVVEKKPLTIKQVINNGLFNGARLDEDKIAELEAADKAREENDK